MTPRVKTCFKCGKQKLITEFYKHPMMRDGHLNKCKKCAKEDSRKNRRAKIETYREYDRNRGNRLSREDIRAMRARHPDWTRAHNAVQKAKMSGKLAKKPCEICGASFVHAHHEDYSKPLDVIWLCPKHHRWVHG